MTSVSLLLNFTNISNTLMASSKRLGTIFMPLKRAMSAAPNMNTPRHKPSNLQKRVLVWTKKFKSVSEVPELVSADMMQRASSEARIKLSNILMLLTVLGSITAILMGKAAAKRGESVHQQNLDWHKQYNEEHNNK